MGIGAGLYTYDVVVKKFTFEISFGEFLYSSGYEIANVYFFTTISYTYILRGAPRKLPSSAI